jgi:hypothetical protein|tara:strand:+ start:1047 stop:1241 length:195 start_codon:yes stop_codon:yes gene_type:complete
MAKQNFNPETRYNSKIINGAVQTLVDDSKITKVDGIDLELFLINTNLEKGAKSELLQFIGKITQ